MVSFEYYLAHGDPRMAKYPLMGSPWPTVMFSLAYFIFLKWICPAWMKNRKPYDLRVPMVIYNISQVIINTWLVVNFAPPWLTKYRWRCEPVDLSDSKDALKMVQICWIFFLSRFQMVFDSVFSVLRKKGYQEPRFHYMVYHHSVLPTISWYAVMYGSGGYGTIAHLGQAFFHSVYFSNYALMAMFPAYRNYFWWRRYIPLLQMVLLPMTTLYISSVYFFPPEYCKVSFFILRVGIASGIVFSGLALFTFTQIKKTTDQTRKNHRTE